MLVMDAGAVAVPLIIGAAIKAPREQVAFLITCDLLACGIASLLQSVGVWRFGIRLPVIMGVTFAAVGPMVAIGSILRSACWAFTARPSSPGYSQS